MEEPTVSSLFERMCFMFPFIPRDIVEFYVNQNSNDERTCILNLQKMQLVLNSTGFQPIIKSYTEPDAASRQFQNLNLNDDDASEDLPDMLPKKAVTKSNGNRSISNAGMPRKPSVTADITTRSQTAPATSNNFQGFSYAMCIPYGSLVYSNNNNAMYQPVITGIDNGVLVPVPYENFVLSNSPRAECPYGEGAPVNSNDPSATSAETPTKSMAESASFAPNIPQRPSSNTYILASPISMHRPMDTPRSPNVQRSTPSPRLEAQSPESNPALTLPERGKCPTPDVGSQLHVSVDPNDTAQHDWIPRQSYSLSPNYSPMSPLSFQVLPAPNSHVIPGASLYQSDLLSAEQVGSQPIWPSAMPIMSTPPLPYGQPLYFQVPTSSAVMSNEIHRNISNQRQRLNSLRYEMEKTKILHANLKKENSEQKLEDKSRQQNDDEITRLKKNIESLRTECFCLCAEVDHYLKGDARLGEINDDFYKVLNTGQQGPPAIPPRPAHMPSSAARSNSQCSHPQFSSEEDEENKESSKWKCSKCTFANHPAISVCEICIEPRDNSTRDPGSTKDC